MAALAPPSSDLSPDAPIYVPQPAAPMLASYLPPPAEVLPPPSWLPGPFSGLPPPPLFAGPYQGPPPPPGLTCPFQGLPPPPPGFASTFRGPPPVFAGPFQGPPPLPGFPCTLPGSTPLQPGFTVPPPFMSFPPPMPSPHGSTWLPAAPSELSAEPQPELPKDRDVRPTASSRPWRAASGRRRPKPLLPPRMLREDLLAPACGTVAPADGGHGSAGGDVTCQPSPRSVLAAAGTSPPDSPPVVLPAAFPFPAPAPGPAPSSPPAPVRQAVAKERRRRRVSPTGNKPGGRGARRGDRMPRRLYDPSQSLTTLMIRNIPNSFTRMKLMNILDQHCAVENEKTASGGGAGVKSQYDFLYVPIDFRTNANKGYCFVNVTTPEAAHRLWEHLHGYQWKVCDSKKTCEVDYASIQGREALVEHFSKSYFECGTPEFLPVWFAPPRDGSRPPIGELSVVGYVRPRRS